MDVLQQPGMEGGVLRGVLVLALAVLVQAGLHRLGQRLPLLLTRRVLGPHATHPDPAFQRFTFLLLIVPYLGLWVGAGWYATEQFALLRAVRDAVAGAVTMGLTAPVFTMNDRGYTVLDCLTLPLLLGVLWVGVNAGTRLVQAQLLRAAGVEHGAQETLGMLVRYAVTLLGGLVILEAWGIDVRTLAIVGSVLGVGIGFGLQNIANNFVSGIVISLERPVKPGDYVRVGEFQGTVERVGARSTEIVTRERSSILVPNSRLLESEVVNWSHRDPTCMVGVKVGVAYGSDLRLVRAALLEAARSHPDVLADPRPSVELHGFGESTLDLELEVWTRNPRRQRDLASDLNQRIEAAFAAHGIAIPFPQRDLHLRSPELAELVTALARRHFTAEELSAARAALRGAAARDGVGDVAAWAPETGPRVWDDVALDALVGRLRGPGGLVVMDRRHLLSVYPCCFIGREAVDWLVRHEEVTREEAVRLGEMLVTRGVIHHVLDEHSFRDGNFFYRFRSDETVAVGA
jgi:potassium-dependent mechanosensitive channel